VAYLEKLERRVEKIILNHRAVDITNKKYPCHLLRSDKKNHLFLNNDDKINNYKKYITTDQTSTDMNAQ